MPDEALSSPASATEQETGAQSVIAGLRRSREQLGAKAKPLRLNVPGYNGDLVIDYKWVPYETLAKSAKTLAKIDEPIALQVAAACDTLIATCKEFLIRVGDEVKPLTLDPSQPITFFGDPRLPEMLGFSPAQNAREAVKAVFNNEYALIRTSAVVIDWLQDTSKRVTEDHLGN